MSVDVEALEGFFSARTLGAPDAAIGFVLWRLVHRFQREMDRGLAGLNLTHLQFTTLALVAWNNRMGAAASQAKLARSAEIEPMQMSQVLTALEAKQLISRQTSDKNARAKLTQITPSGLQRLDAAMPVAIEIQQRIFGDDGAPGGKLLELLGAIKA